MACAATSYAVRPGAEKHHSRRFHGKRRGRSGGRGPALSPLLVTIKRESAVEDAEQRAAPPRPLAAWE